VFAVRGKTNKNKTECVPHSLNKDISVVGSSYLLRNNTM